MSNQWQGAASAAAKRHMAAQDDSCDHPNGFGVNGCPCGASAPAEMSDQAPTVVAMDDVKKGPWFYAKLNGVCSAGSESVEAGDQIRADGWGGYECSECAGDEDREETDEPLRVHSLGHLTGSTVTADEFLSLARSFAPGALAAEGFPTPDEFLNAAEPEPKINVSGQPEAERDWLGRYIVIDTGTGDFRRTKTGKPIGITRVTTFVKAAQNNKAIGDWQKRNVVMGASLRPDVLRRAHGLNHDNGKDELDRIVGELDTAAGGKVSADEGTYLHEETEYIDAGVKRPEDCPPAYQEDLKRYVAALEAYGLEPVPGLIERTVMVREFGGVCGTFDRVFFHRASDTYVIGDLKTGKTLKYGMDEIQAQMWLYAHGINQNGVYDWNTKTWGPAGDPMTVGSHPDGVPIRVREDVGVIIHMPVQGPEAGDVYVRKADLSRGAEYAALCASVRGWTKSKVQDWTGLPEPTWEERFAAVWDKSEATILWRLAKDRGITGVRLNELVAIAQRTLRVKG